MDTVSHSGLSFLQWHPAGAATLAEREGRPAWPWLGTQQRHWKPCCWEQLPHGQTNGLAVDGRGAGWGCPRTCRWGMC